MVYVLQWTQLVWSFNAMSINLGAETKQGATAQYSQVNFPSALPWSDRLHKANQSFVALGQRPEKNVEAQRASGQ